MVGYGLEEFPEDEMLMPNTRKGPRSSNLLDGMEENPNSLIQPAYKGNTVKDPDRQLRKNKPSKRQRVGEIEEEENKEEKGADLVVTVWGTTPALPVLEGFFTLVFMKGEDDIILTNNSGLSN